MTENKTNENKKTVILARKCPRCKILLTMDRLSDCIKNKKIISCEKCEIELLEIAEKYKDKLLMQNL